ncbi:MAG: hypothetical protein ACSNEK_09530 [Parachlamydiaceae bacterium]
MQYLSLLSVVLGLVIAPCIVEGSEQKITKCHSEGNSTFKQLAALSDDVFLSFFKLRGASKGGEDWS